MHKFWKPGTSKVAVAASVIVLTLGALLSAPRGHAATLVWTNGSGVFTDPSKWDPAQAPATDDTTIFTNDTSLTVTLTSSSPVMNSSVFSNHAGIVTINASGFTWTLTNAFRIGVGDATSTVYLAGGTLSVADIDAPFVGGQLRIADAGTNILSCVGTLVVTNGIVAVDATVVGAGATSVGNLIISGPGVLQDGGTGSGSTLTLGAGGSNSRLIVTNGGKLIVDGTITVGSTLGSSNNLVLFSGPTSAGTMSSQGMLLRGNNSMLIISNGAKVYMAGQGTLGSNSSGCTGVVVGAGSELIIAGTSGLQVGANSSGGTNNFFIVYDGGRLSINNGTLAFGNNAFHVADGIQIGGPGLMSTGFARVVRSASNNTNHQDNFVTVTNGFFSCNYLNSQGPREFITVLANGTWKLTNGFAIAAAAASSNTVNFNNTGVGSFLTINGGTMINVFSTDENNPGGFSFGGVGGISLIVTNGGRYFTSRGTLGAASSFNTGIVVGVGSVWSNAAGPAGFTNFIVVGTGAAGSNNFLGVFDGGKLYNNGTLNIGNNGFTAVVNTVRFGGPGLPVFVSNTGFLNIGADAGSYGNSVVITNATVNCGTLNVGNSGATNNLLELRGGTLAVGFMRVRPSNTVLFTAGTLSVGDMTFDTGANNSNAFVVGDASSPAYYDMVGGGTGYHNFNNGGLVVTNGAFLRGNGTLAGNVTVLGTFEPGFSVGSIYSSNTLRFGSTAVLNYDLGTLSDSVTVNGSLILGGTLNVADSGGFAAGTYTLFTHTNAVSGTLTVGTLPSGFTATVSTDTLPFVRLIVTPSGGGDPYTTWATFYGLSGGNAAGNADPDGDGMSNTNEFLAGFNPTNSAAYLRVINIAQSGNDIVVTYLGANGDSNGSPGPKTNILEFTTGAAGNYSNNFTSAGVTNILTGGNGSGVVTNMVDVGGATSNPARYYRVRVLLP